MQGGILPQAEIRLDNWITFEIFEISDAFS